MGDLPGWWDELFWRSCVVSRKGKGKGKLFPVVLAGCAREEGPEAALQLLTEQLARNSEWLTVWNQKESKGHHEETVRAVLRGVGTCNITS